MSRSALRCCVTSVSSGRWRWSALPSRRPWQSCCPASASSASTTRSTGPRHQDAAEIELLRERARITAVGHDESLGDPPGRERAGDLRGHPLRDGDCRRRADPDHGRPDQRARAHGGLEGWPERASSAGRPGDLRPRAAHRRLLGRLVQHDRRSASRHPSSAPLPGRGPCTRARAETLRPGITAGQLDAIVRRSHQGEGIRNPCTRPCDRRGSHECPRLVRRRRRARGRTWSR